jgi:hypothetical protein
MMTFVTNSELAAADDLEAAVFFQSDRQRTGLVIADPFAMRTRLHPT